MSFIFGKRGAKRIGRALVRKIIFFILLATSVWLFCVRLPLARHPSAEAAPSNNLNKTYLQKILPPRMPGAVRIMSWNMNHLGVRKAAFVRELSSVLQLADVVVIQEVDGEMGNGPAMLRLLAHQIEELSNTTDESVPGFICYGFTQKFERNHERYGYIWNRLKLLWLRHDVVEDRCPKGGAEIDSAGQAQEGVSRPAGLATFRVRESGNKDFLLSTIHLRPKKEDPQFEVGPLFRSYRQDRPTIVAGDFNLHYTPGVFQLADVFGFQHTFSKYDRTTLMRTKTSLNENDDNFFYKFLVLQGSAKVLNLYSLFENLEPSFVYRNISDHSPIVADFLVP